MAGEVGSLVGWIPSALPRGPVSSGFVDPGARSPSKKPVITEIIGALVPPVIVIDELRFSMIPGNPRAVSHHPFGILTRGSPATWHPAVSRITPRQPSPPRPCVGE